MGWVRCRQLKFGFMAIPLHILEERLGQARLLYPEVERGMHQRAMILQQAIAKGNAPPTVEQDYTHRFKRTNWQCRLRVSAHHVEAHAMLWWVHRKKGGRFDALDAILLRGFDMPLHFDSHFWSRWGLRTELLGVLMTNMMGFFRQYPQPPVRGVRRFYDKQPDDAAALAEGLILGRRNGKRLISCDTFKHHALLSEDERKLWRLLAEKPTTVVGTPVTILFPAGPHLDGSEGLSVRL